jgi:FkbM family methyltransferase
VVNLSRELPRKGRKLMSLVREPAFRAPLRHGVAATVEHSVVPFRDDYRVVIDVGAGRGQFAVFALRRFPRARIISFEPLPVSLHTAERAVGRSSRLELRQLAIGSSSGTATIHVTADADSSSLRRPTSEQTTRFPGTDDVGVHEVEVTTLDDALSVLEDPVLLKLDLQGGELDALRGAEHLLSSVATVFAECSFVELYEGQALADEVICHLRERGFTLRGVFSPTFGSDGTCVQADLLFESLSPR